MSRGCKFNGISDALPLVETSFGRKLMIDYSKKRAVAILDNYIEIITKKYEKYIVSIILVGSLTNNSYIDGPGRDVDQITVLRSGTPEEVFFEVVDSIREINNFNRKEILLSESVYYLDELNKPYRKDFKFNLKTKRLLEVPVELLRIFESGIVVYGEEQISDLLEKPNKADVIFFNNLSREWKNIRGNTIIETMDSISKLSPRIEIQILLTSAMTHYYYDTNKSCSNKHEIANRIREEVPDYAFQNVIDLATDIKLNMDRQYISEEINKLREGCKSMMEWNYNNPEGLVPKLTSTNTTSEQRSTGEWC